MSPHASTSSRRPVITALAVAGLAVGGLAVTSGTPISAAQPGDLGRFDTWVGYDVGKAPRIPVLADLDGDGALDVLWGTAADHVTVSRNLGDGTLLPATELGAGKEVSGLEAVDLDGDGDLDAVASYYVNHTAFDVGTYLNDGTGELTYVPVEAGSEVSGMAVGDLDGDDDPDLVITSYGAGRVEVLLNQGDATFVSGGSYAVGPQSFAIELLDLQGDDVLDVVVTVRPSTTGLVRLDGAGDGTFSVDAGTLEIPDVYTGINNRPVLATGDTDDDGDTDLVVGGGDQVAVLENDGAGELTVIGAGENFGVRSLVLHDLDDDGDLDLASAGGGGGVNGSFRVQRNDGTGAFDPAERGMTSNNPYGVAVGDLDRDGRVDLVVANNDTATGSTHLQRADGTFASPPVGTGFLTAREVEPADLDGDGDLDLASIGRDGSRDVIRTAFNDGEGGLTEGAFIRWEDPTSRESRALTAADLDGDGDIDLTWLSNEYDAQRVVQSMNDGDGTFSAPTVRQVDTCAASITVADVDEDGDLDEIFSNRYQCGDTESQTLSVLISYNDGDGTFSGDTYVRMVSTSRDVVAEDVDGDGHVDLVAVGVEYRAGSTVIGDVAVSLGDGSGTFPRGADLLTGNAHVEAASADLDGDGDVDLVTDSRQQGTTVLLNDGSGSFTASTLPGEYVHGYTNAIGVAVGDVDGDTIPDVVVAHVTGSDVGVHTGNGDGTFELRQVRYGLRPYVTDVELADLDGDGVLDVVSPASTSMVLDGAGASADGEAADTGVLVLTSRRAECTITGTPGDDTLKGTRRTDVICGLGGNDTITGKGGGDILRGGPGHDTLRGGTGVDLLDGETGDDKLKGEDGDDRLRGGTGKDTLRGGKGRDVLDLLDGTKGNDTGNAGGTGNHCRADKKDTVRCG